MDPLSLLWLFFILASLQPGVQRQWMLAARRRALASISKRREMTVITLIHRQESMNLLGFPLVRYIDVDDAEGILRAINETPQGRPIEIILHTPGGLVLAAQQIAAALADHDAQVTAVIPHYAMSGGTLIALAADEIVMDEAAVLGPVDPQLGDLPAAALVRVVGRKPIERLDDRTLLLADVAEKALRHMKQVVRDLLVERLGEDRAETIAEELAGGHYTHDDPITIEEATAFGLPVATGLPREVYDLMELYPQEGRRRPSVQFVPLPEPTADPKERR
jgi:ClpP class serine protease